MWAPLRYWCVHDVPRIVLFGWGSDSYVMYSLFDDDLDEYSDFYTVEVHPGVATQQLLTRDWASGIPDGGKELGKVPVSEVKYDFPIRPNVIDVSILKRFGR